MLNEIRKRMKFIKTCNLSLSFFTLGTAMSLTGPCLLDLQHMVQTDTQHIAVIYTARSLGYLLGSIIGGILLDIIRSKQAVLMGCNLCVAITMFSIPWCRNVEILMTFMCINGFALGAIETGGNVLCLELWGKDSNPIFQILHSTFSLGGLLSPLIAAPFLEYIKDMSLDAENTTTIIREVDNSTSNFSSLSANISVSSSKDIPQIIYPFSILGAIALLVTVLHLAACIISSREDRHTKDNSKMGNSERSFSFMFFVVIFTFMIFFVISGTEIGYGQTLTLFSVKSKLHLTTTKGSYVTSAFWAALTVSRLSSVFLSMKISSLKLIMGDICLLAIAAIILLFCMPNEWALWLASATFGAGIASVFGSLVVWINNYINISNKFSSIFTVGCAAGEMVVPFLVTFFIDTVPEMFSYVTAASAILTSILLFILHCMFNKGRKVKQPKNVDCSVIEATETRKEVF